MISAAVNLNRATFNWCLANADAAMRQGDEASAARWLGIAAESASDFGPCGELASAPLEKAICRLAAGLPLPSQRPAAHPPQRWLHVVTEMYPVFGHSAFLCRWIERDQSGCEHHIVATEQIAPFPDHMRAASARTGGQVSCLDPRQTEMLRAEQLRRLTWETADVVVVHARTFDVIPPIAFGVVGGPPVLVLNHADHLFWIGASMADLVINFRPLGQGLTEGQRGCSASAMLPIPLPEPTVASDPVAQASLRSATRAQLDIPQDAVVFLTVGQSYKYDPALGMDFYAAAERILSVCNNAYVIAVGPTADGRAKAVSDATGGRFLAVGICEDLTGFHAAADVYLEGFPLGSLTALLEASLAGLPCVRTPQLVPLQFCSDGRALDGQPRPADVAAYIEAAIALARANVASRQALAAPLSERIRAVHCGAGWMNSFDALRSILPCEHAAPRELAPTPLPEDVYKYWLTFVNRLGRNTLELVIEAARRRSLAPRAPIGVELWKALQTVRSDAAARWALRFHAMCPLLGRLGQHFVFNWLESEKMAAKARQIWPFGDCPAVRAAVVCAFVANPLKLADASLWKMLIKSIAGKNLLGTIREYRCSRRRIQAGKSLGDVSQAAG